MFNWFHLTCTVDPVTRDWIDRRWHWLTEEFGSEVMVCSPTVLPNDEFFPEKFDHSDESVRVLLDRVCKYMGADPAKIQLELYSNNGLPYLVNESGHAIGHSAGTYQQMLSRYHIRIERTQLQDTMHLVGTMAHELAHARLLGEERLSADAFDNEILTDLTVVFHGLGIFLANVPRHWHSHVTNWPGTDVPKPEYMTTPMYGYALARRCWLREEPLPKWRKYLGPGVRAEFKQAFRYLQSLESGGK